MKPRTLQAFDEYSRGAEARIAALERGPLFLWTDQSPERHRQVRQGAIVVERVTGKDPAAVPEGLIHDWIGAVFLPGATLPQVIGLVQDYDQHKDVYAPEVGASKLVNRNGSDFQVFLRLLKKKVITVVLDTYYDVHYAPVDETRWCSRSYSTRIQEVENASKPNEHALPPGEDHGFLWRLNSYWRFLQRDGGVYVECEAISLTRDIPMGLGWVVGPVVRDLPRESLVSTLQKTRDALAKRGSNN